MFGDFHVDKDNNIEKKPSSTGNIYEDGWLVLLLLLIALLMLIL